MPHSAKPAFEIKHTHALLAALGKCLIVTGTESGTGMVLALEAAGHELEKKLEEVKKVQGRQRSVTVALQTPTGSSGSASNCHEREWSRWAKKGI